MVRMLTRLCCTGWSGSSSFTVSTGAIAIANGTPS